MFVFVVPDRERCWYQSFVAGDQIWGAAALRRMLADSSWRQYAARTSAPVSIRLSTLSPAEERNADHLGMAEAWLVPAPAPPSSDALGGLVLSVREGQPLPSEYELMPIYRALALALLDWALGRMRQALIERAHLTERDIELLRHEQAGHGSKQIAAALLAEPKTIDCRFHRLNVRLGVANRRDAVRLCQRYGLL